MIAPKENKIHNISLFLYLIFYFRHTLTIPSALPEDKGLYIVRAVNTGGVVHCGADVIVEEKSPEELDTEEAEIHEEESATNKGTPIFFSSSNQDVKQH